MAAAARTLAGSVRRKSFGLRTNPATEVARMGGRRVDGFSRVIRERVFLGRKVKPKVVKRGGEGASGAVFYQDKSAGGKPFGVEFTDL